MTALDAQAADEQREPIVERDVDAWVREISERGWLRLDWFENVRVGGGLELAARDEGEEGDDEAALDEGEEDRDVRRSQRPLAPPALASHDPNSVQCGLGTMMQARVDYLSESKRLDYLDWKAGIVGRIEELERSRAKDTPIA